MRRNPIPVLILALSLVAVALAYLLFNRTIVPRYVGARGVLARPSVIHLSLAIRHTTGPLAEEDYAMNDVEGASSSSYRVAGRNGTTISIAERPDKTLDPDRNIAFFFGRVVQDGVWELTNKPPRGDVSTSYTVHVFQAVDGQQGSRTFTFTDPHYWATVGGHQFHIKLDKNKPVPDLLQMTSTVLVEPRYAELVDDFRSFGPAAFRERSARARQRLGARS